MSYGEPQPAQDADQAPRDLRRARLEYAVVDGQVEGIVTIAGGPAHRFQSVSELERCLGLGRGHLVLAPEMEPHLHHEYGLATLSDRERAIAGAAARGMSNREIAGAMFYSVKSVEAYLTRIYRRLGIIGREDLAALGDEFDDLPLVDGDTAIVGGSRSSGAPGRRLVTVELFVL